MKTSKPNKPTSQQEKLRDLRDQISRLDVKVDVMTRLMEMIQRSLIRSEP